MRGPFLQRLLALGMVIGAVIGAGDTRLVAGLIDRGLDNVRLHAKLAHASRHRPARVVQRFSFSLPVIMGWPEPTT